MKPQPASIAEVRTVQQTEEEDLFFGQSVILWARWAVIAAGIVLALWSGVSANDVNQLVVTVPWFFALMAMNFFLHGRYVMGSPLNRNVVMVAGLVDLVAITLIVMFWPGRQHGVYSQFFVLYYPVVFAFALVFPRRQEAIYTVLAMAAYLTACVVTSPGALFDVGHGLGGLKVVAMRLVVIAAMGFLGNLYFRIERDRVRRASQGGPSALDELQARVRARPPQPRSF